MCVFCFFNFFAFISVNSLFGVLGTAPTFGLSEEIEFVPVFMSSKQCRKRKFFRVLFVLQVVKKSELDVQNLLFFHSLIGLIAVAVTVAFVVAPRI